MREGAAYYYDGKNEGWLAGCLSLNVFGRLKPKECQKTLNLCHLGDVFVDG
jgi:hypothetical protein